MLKKGYSSFLAVIFSLIFMFGVTACSNDTSSEPANNEPAANVQESEPEVVVEVEECDEEKILVDKAVPFFNAIQNDNNQAKVDVFAEQFELARDNVFVLDIRKNDAFAEGHLAGANNIPFAEIGQRLDELPKDKEIMVMCYTGQTGGQTTGILRMLGYNAKNLSGGYNNGIQPNAELFEIEK